MAETVDDKVGYFQAITGIPDTNLCAEILAAHNWDLQLAVNSFTGNPSSPEPSMYAPPPLEADFVAPPPPAPAPQLQQQPGIAWRLVTLPFYVVSGGVGLITGSIRLGVWVAGGVLSRSLSHYYYHFCESLFPFKDWWAVPVKVAFDQTAWSALWNSIYFVTLGFLRWESPSTIFSELKSTFFPMLTAGWKLWPFAHLITYGVVPLEQRLLWVDCVELIWVTILSTYSNEKSEARISDGPSISADSEDTSR